MAYALFTKAAGELFNTTVSQTTPTRREHKRADRTLRSVAVDEHVEELARPANARCSQLPSLPCKL